MAFLLADDGFVKLTVLANFFFYGGALNPLNTLLRGLDRVVQPAVLRFKPFLFLRLRRVEYGTFPLDLQQLFGLHFR